jgi:pyruvate dehydrogenase E2 component (dihydrolipoamide acetyltransferase)
VYEFRLPDLGEGIHEGEILRWHVTPGDVVSEDDPLVAVETDKAAVTIPSPRAGRVVSLGAAVGDVVSVGDVITVIDATGAHAPPVSTDKAAPTTTAPATRPATRSHAKADAPRRLPAAVWGRAVATPATRRLARELKIDINQVPPTGADGRVTPDDLTRFARGDGGTARAAPATQGTKGRRDEGTGEKELAPGPSWRSARAEKKSHVCSAEGHGQLDRPAPPASLAPGAGIPFLDIEELPDFEQWGPVEREPLRSIRRKVAHKMTTSMILVPHVAHMDEADVTFLEEFRIRERENRKDQPGGRLTLLAFVVKAVSAGLRAAPSFNASLDPFREEIVYKKYYHIGIAVDTGKGLVVPVIRNADHKTILEIAQDIESLATRAREGTLDVADLRGGTFTITNVGPLGGTALIPTINYPEVAILGMGRVQEKPVVRHGQIVIRKMLPLTLAFDHRIADGADAARFVTEMARQLEDPTRLLLVA